MLNGIHNILVPSVNQFTVQGRRMSLPVDASSVIYSNFQYVRGTPAPEGTHGVGITRLNLLDVLIGRLNQAALEQQSTRDLDSLLERYRNMIIEAQAASAAMPYIPSPDAQPGALLNLLG